jgi:hypothetical protein
MIHVNLFPSLLSVHALSTLMMTGLIWTIQLVHYPLFSRVGADVFCDYERQHQRRITWLVAPLMLIEAVSAAMLVVLLEPGGLRVLAVGGVLLLLVIWGSTALLQVPCHTHLSRGFDREVVRRLVSTNWIRTVAWSIRGVLAVTLFQAVPQ